MRLLNTQRREDTVVDSVVQEQDFAGSTKIDASGSMSWTTMKLTPAARILDRTSNRRANAEECQNREDHP